jgi:starvation-inducible DNA-binding protein
MVRRRGTAVQRREAWYQSNKLREKEMGPKIEIVDENSTRVAASLKTLLADEYVLSMRTREAHRYIHGSNFATLRKLFEAQYKSMDIIVADVSRKVRTLGLVGLTAIANSIEETRLGQHNEKFKGQYPIVEALVDDHETMIRELKMEGLYDEKTDIRTSDFMAGLVRQHEDMAKGLREWLH